MQWSILSQRLESYHRWTRHVTYHSNRRAILDTYHSNRRVMSRNSATAESPWYIYEYIYEYIYMSIHSYIYHSENSAPEREPTESLWYIYGWISSWKSVIYIWENLRETALPNGSKWKSVIYIWVNFQLKAKVCYIYMSEFFQLLKVCDIYGSGFLDTSHITCERVVSRLTPIVMLFREYRNCDE